MTTGASYTTTQTSVQAARSSAEVVAETPSDGEIRLADFRMVRFSDCAINGRPINVSLFHRFDLTSDRHVVEAVTSELGDRGIELLGDAVGRVAASSQIHCQH